MRAITAVAAPLLLFALVSPGASPQLASPLDPQPIAATALAQDTKGTGPPVDEFVGPFASWVDVRAQGARGDGVADDTAPLQAALDRLGPDDRSPVVLIPAGTYRITRSLSLNYQLAVGVVGEDPERTRIVWDGPEGGQILVVRGVAYSRISRLTFDGRGKAAVAVEQTWDNTHGNFDSGNEYADDRFVDVGFGIHGGFAGHGFAETSVVRARFIRNASAGIALGNFNALDLWVWSSLFEDCGAGITNDPGAGNFRVYDSVFRRSKVADLVIQNTGLFTARHNYSAGSNAFWVSGAALNHPATVDIQDNTIIDPKSAVAVRMANQGPALILDNRIRSLPNTSGPVITWRTLFGSDVVSIGNTFTVTGAVSANGRLVTLDDRTVAASAIDAREPVLPVAQPNLRRRIIEIAAGASAPVIQQAIESAARDAGARPVVHLPFGIYSIDRPLVVPPSDVQLVGDGSRTILRWTGSGRGPVVTLQSPTRATLRELQIEAKGADGMLAGGFDQPRARVHLEGVQLRAAEDTNLLIERPGRATVQMVDLGHAYTPRGTSMRIVGPGGDGAGEGRLAIYSGASAGHGMTYDISNGATLIARDVWYEGREQTGFVRLRDAARLTLQGARVSTPRDVPQPAFAIDSTARSLTLLSSLFDDRIVVTGGSGRPDILGVANMQEQSRQAYFTNDSTSPARVLMLDMRQRVSPSGLIPRGTVPVADIGTMNGEFVRAMLRDTRELASPSLAPVPAGSGDLRMFRVWITGGATNLTIRGQ